ncbi:MAG: ABC transporter permease [Phycisphaerales bacterium]|nr:MAG: ABC transporter permease [Phycisphaerales bacterium]
MLLRLLFQTVGLALSTVWASKVRAMLTMLGIIVAAFSVVSTIGFMTGAKQYVLDQFETFGANKVWIFPRRPEGQRDRYSFRQIRLTKDQADGILPNCPSLARLSPVMELSAQIQFKDTIKDFVRVQGIRPDWHAIENRSVTLGRTFQPTDEAERLQVCLINDKGVQELSLPADPTGEPLLIAGRRFTIVGIVETLQVSPMFGGGEPQSEVFIPFATGEMIQPEPRFYIVAQSKAPDLFEDAKAEVTFYMRKARNLMPDEPDTFGVEAIDQFIAGFKRIAGFLTGIVAVLVGISLVVGGIGIMNIMLVSVSERTREIGLRKAVGARPDIILLQFLVEAVTLCILGGTIGLLLGEGVVLIARIIPDSPLKGAMIPPWAIALALLFSAGTGVVFGMFPAIKAARLDPIDALRHE